MTLELLCKQRLTYIDDNMRRSLRMCDNLGDGYVIFNGRKLLSFCSNDYLNLSKNELIRAAAVDAINLYGVGGCASRMVCGNYNLYDVLEKKLAKMCRADRALVFSSGFVANYSVVSVLLNRQDLLLVDRNIHASVIAGSKHVDMKRFEHNSVESCAEMLSRHRDAYDNCMICVETVYSMDGDLAPLDDLYKVAKKFNCWFAVDHAHSVCCDHDYAADIKVGTLSKMLASSGGYVCADESTIELLMNKAAGLTYSTSLPPAAVAGAIAACDIVSVADNLGYPRSLAEVFCRELGLPQAQSQIVPLRFSTVDEVLALELVLLEAGYLAIAMRPPTVRIPCIRFIFSTAHSVRQVVELCNLIKSSSFRYLTC